MTIRKATIFFIAMVCLTAIASVKTVHGSFLDTGTIHIGVLAKLGKENCFQQWNPTATYLKEKFPEHNVQIVCLDFEEIDKVVADKHVDFTITNPSVYVNLEYKHGATRISTLKNKRSDKSYTYFGGVIFYRADRKDIKTVEDLKGKGFMAVAENSFGGWQVSYRYLKDRGIDPYNDFQSLQFKGRHDAVVMDILNASADAGCVRTDTLERMAAEGKIDLHDIAILDPQSRDADFNFFRTTRLYPEWPLAKAKHTGQELARRVALAMMQMPDNSIAAFYSQSRGWTIPLEYHDVHDALRLLKIAPYEAFGTITYRQLYQQYKAWIYISVIFFACTFCGITLVLVLNKRLNSAIVDLESEHQQRALIVADLNEFKLTLEQTLDCVFMFSPDDLQFIYANQGALDQVGYSRIELLNMVAVDIKTDFTEIQFRALVEPLMENPQKSLTFTTSHRKKDGTFIPVEIYLRYIIPPQKRGRFVAIVRDITLRQQRDREREQLQSKLLHEQKLASVGQLAAGIAHEINTPTQYLGSNIDFLKEAFEDISGLITHYDLLLKATRKNQVSQQLITAAENSAEEVDWPYLEEEIPLAIKQSIDGLKQVSSIVLAMKNFSHPGKTEKEMTNLNDLLQTTLTVSRNEWKLLADPFLDLDPQLPQVACMRNEIGQVFLNIIVNAAHAIADKLGENPEGKKGKIRIVSRVEGSIVKLTFTDSGCGISKENLQKIFDPFFTTKEVGKGTGQGLTISYDIITSKHGGTLEATSEEGVGTTFTIALLVNPPQMSDSEENHND